MSNNSLNFYSIHTGNSALATFPFILYSYIILMFLLQNIILNKEYEIHVTDKSTGYRNSKDIQTQC